MSHGNIDSVKMRLPTKANALHGGHCRGPLLDLVVWDLYDGIISREFDGPLVAKFHLPGLWLGLDLWSTDHHGLSVGEWRHERQTLFTLLCLPGWLPVYDALHALGSGDPRWRCVGTARCRDLHLH